MDRDRFRHHVTGPIVSINTPFLADGALDYVGLRRMIDVAIAAGARTVLFTPGDSLYAVLAESEIAELTKVAAEHVGDRAQLIAAANCWWTGQSVEFATYARDVGADAIIVIPPFRDGTPRDLADYFLAVSRELPVVVLSASLSPLGVEGALDVVRLLLAEGDSIAGVKEDYGPAFARRACLLAHERWGIFAGGQKQTHLDMLPYGCDGYMSLHLLYRPEIARAYWSAVETGDVERAATVIRDHDLPLFQTLYGHFAAGGDAAQHGVLELLGVCQRWRRPPLPSLTDADMELLAAELANLGIR